MVEDAQDRRKTVHVRQIPSPDSIAQQGLGAPVLELSADADKLLATALQDLRDKALADGFDPCSSVEAVERRGDLAASVLRHESLEAEHFVGHSSGFGSLAESTWGLHGLTLLPRSVLLCEPFGKSNGNQKETKKKDDRLIVDFDHGAAQSGSVDNVSSA